MKDILIVDDDPQILDLLKHLLEEEGMRVCCVASGEEALRQMQEESFVLMITDFSMPGLNGMDLAKKAKAIAPRMPIIMTTGDLAAELRRQALEAGINRFFSKPYKPVEILLAVREVLGKQR